MTAIECAPAIEAGAGVQGPPMSIAGAAPMAKPVRLRLAGDSVLVASGLAIELGAQFARTMILAKLLGANEFGLVVSINMLAALADMFSFIGLDRFIVYAREGGEARALAVAHSLSLLRGVVCAALILVMALPTAAIIGAREYVFSFALVAGGPLLRGAAHLGVMQKQREGHFAPSAAADAGAAIFGLAAALAAALVAPDHRAILWGLGAQAAGNLMLTHLFARDVPYRLSFDRARVVTALQFGLPLLVNGMALSAAMQFDRMVVGSWLGVAAVGVYGLASILVSQPLAMLVRLATTVMQPRISAAWHDDRAGMFPQLVSRLGRDAALLGGVGAAGAACLGAPAMHAVFGPGFAPSDMFFVLMSGVVLTRLQRGAINLVGLAIGRTFDLMVANIIGAVALPVMILAFYIHAGPASAVFGVLAGEVAGFAAAYIRLRRFCSATKSAMLRNLIRTSIIPVSVGAWILLANPALPLRVGAVVVACAFGGLFLFGGHAWASWRGAPAR